VVPLKPIISEISGLILGALQLAVVVLGLTDQLPCSRPHDFEDRLVYLHQVKVAFLYPPVCQSGKEQLMNTDITLNCIHGHESMA
jgi:hypothetical protein